MNNLDSQKIKREQFNNLQTGQIIWAYKEKLKQLDGSEIEDPEYAKGRPRTFVVFAKKDSNNVVIVNAKILSEIFNEAEKQNVPMEVIVLELESNNNRANLWFDDDSKIGINDRGEKVYKVNRDSVNRLTKEISALNLSITQTISFDEFDEIGGRLNNTHFYDMIFNLTSNLENTLTILNKPKDSGKKVEYINNLTNTHLVESVDNQQMTTAEYTIDGIQYVVESNSFCRCFWYKFSIDDIEYEATWDLDREKIDIYSSDNYNCLIDTLKGNIIQSDFDQEFTEYIGSILLDLAGSFILDYLSEYPISIDSL